ncbi:MAG: hypothetical protein Q8M98_08355 [Candidatus Cloacimonadaceae bacterium]|nr:hypothetical protein [Candidatus Cloacimonadaceae bacterium]
MVFKQEDNPKRLKEFIGLVENHKIDLRHYKTPVLVWAVQDGTAYYSFWDKDILERFGLGSVDGYDFEEDALFCPDWISDRDDDDDDFEDDDSDDNELICNLRIDNHKA